MKYILAFITILLGFSLTACGLFEPSISYDDFTEHHVTSYYQAEHQSNNRYILYYYDSTDDIDKDFTTDLLTFFETFDALEYYLLDTSKIETEISDFGGYTTEPIIYVVSNQEVYETYKGINQINAFILLYSDIQYDYDLFQSQTLDTYNDALDITNDAYILYYYDDEVAQSDDFLQWAFTKSAEDIYFINKNDIPESTAIPSELIILREGTPMMIVMSNGTYTGEYYEGSDHISEYISLIGSLDIIANDMTLDYDDFSDYFLTSFDQSLTISDTLHFEYYYSPYCSHCNAIKSMVLSFFDYIDTEVYLINASSATGTVKIDSFYGTPTLYLVKDNEVVLELVGSLAIPEFIQQYYNGEIDLNSYE